MHPQRIGLYLHLPFCARICHYCDFVKSALYTDDQKSQYIENLDELLDQWIQALPGIPDVERTFYSLFWGGGTPSLVTRELTPIMEKVRPFLKEGAESSLEANPEHIEEGKLKIWAELGINRLSLGVQSFSERGLKAMTREHGREEALRAVRLAQDIIPNVNVDLIYGWPGQTEEEWKSDVDAVLELRPTHLSLYNLTFEGRTPFARRVERGLMHPADDGLLESFYRAATERLGDAGYLHEEVSNWALPGFHARHNGLYWNGGSYIGLGAGAHSYLETVGPFGCRWNQDANWRQFKNETRASDHQSLIARSDMRVDEGRDADAWILEVVSSGLRTAKGINVNAICRKTGYTFEPQPAVRQALELGWMALSSDGILTLSPTEWFRETRWSLECSLSFSADK